MTADTVYFREAHLAGEPNSSGPAGVTARCARRAIPAGTGAGIPVVAGMRLFSADQRRSSE